MIYFKNTIIVITVLLLTIQTTFAFYHTKWEDVCDNLSNSPKACHGEGITQVKIDLDSVNIHNDSIYYAIGYCKDPGGCKVAIIQYKNGKAGIIKTYGSYEYEHTYMQRHTEYSHPAYTLQEAANFKEINKDSFIYETLNLAKMAIEVKKAKPSYWGLVNRLYEF